MRRLNGIAFFFHFKRGSSASCLVVPPHHLLHYPRFATAVAASPPKKPKEKPALLVKPRGEKTKSPSAASLQPQASLLPQEWLTQPPIDIGSHKTPLPASKSTPAKNPPPRASANRDSNASGSAASSTTEPRVGFSSLHSFFYKRKTKCVFILDEATMIPPSVSLLRAGVANMRPAEGAL